MNVNILLWKWTLYVHARLLSYQNKQTSLLFQSFKKCRIEDYLINIPYGWHEIPSNHFSIPMKLLLRTFQLWIMSVQYITNCESNVKLSFKILLQIKLKMLLSKSFECRHYPDAPLCIKTTQFLIWQILICKSFQSGLWHFIIKNKPFCSFLSQ